MKILLVMMAPVENLSSAVLRTLAVVKGLVDLNHDVTILCLENASGSTYVNVEKYKFLKDVNTKDNSVYLARPWRDYGFVTFKNCYLDNHIKQEGFSVWEGTDRHLHARFIEINSSGPGANKQKRISWSKVI